MQGRHAGQSAITRWRSWSSGAQRRVSLPEATTTLGVRIAAATCETAGWIE